MNEAQQLLAALGDALRRADAESEQLRNENTELKREVHSLRSENKAVRTAFETLKQLRERDRNTIRSWQEQLGLTLQSDEATQDLPSAAILPTDPPISVLPASSPPPAAPAAPAVAPAAGEADSDVLETKSESIENESSERATEASDPLSSSQLCARDWHPEDFVLNPEIRHTARFEELADKQDTPSGFWDVDFPSSSQIERQRAAAREQIKQEGRRRLKEALNDGKYVFKNAHLRRSMRRRS